MYEKYDIKHFNSLFNSRKDVFALRWEKAEKSGYFPAYQYDPYYYKLHKIKGGTFQNYNEKSYFPLTDEQIIKHLNGDQFIGIYPLFNDNTSCFIVADFDDDNWVNECRIFLETCKNNGIHAYLERSRSGNGGHVWIFFEQAYPAFKSRKIIKVMLEETGLFSLFDKSSSFDRLFPNQDTLSGKGLGNLIALPLNKHALEKGNCCFIDSETLKPFIDQFEFLKTIRKVSVSELDKLFLKYSNLTEILPIKNNIKISISEKLIVKLSNNIHINRNAIPLQLINYLKKELNFVNSEFIIKNKIGKNTMGIKHFFKFIEESENEITIPRGIIGRLLRFCKENKIEYNFNDERVKYEKISFSSNIILREYQELAVIAASKKDIGVIIAPPGSGKTIIGLKIITEKQQPALIIVHRKQIAEQWIEKIQSFLNIPKYEIGMIGQEKFKIGKKITIAMIQSMAKEFEKSKIIDFQNSFGTIIVDECHHIPAETYRNIITRLNAYYIYGLTATPFRKYNDGKLIFIYLGDVIVEVKPQEIPNNKKAIIVIRNTELDVPFNSRNDKFETLSKILVHDSARNKLILKDIIQEVNSGRRAVVITERKEHIDVLNQYLKQSFDTIMMSGEDSENSRIVKWKILKEGNFQILITTGQFFGEGTDLHTIDCLFIVYPFSFEGKLIQYIGRVQRSEITPYIYDYRDYKIDYLNKLFLKRNTYYRKLEKQASLFDEQGAEVITTEDTFIYERIIKVPFEQIEFRYGSIVFKHEISEKKVILDFEIDNLDLRPEFDILKPYFSKYFKIKTLEIFIYVEFENIKVISQIATSKDLERINREIIDSIKFRYVSKAIFRKNHKSKDKNILDLNQLLSSVQDGVQLYDSEKELLNYFLKNKNIKHYRQILYLAQKHESKTLKLRFVLNPFSFVFLLSGSEQFHIVLETLDTEEATYIWHFNKNNYILQQKLKEIDKSLNIIRNEGRQVYIKNHPENFSRIVHDYSDEQKGFIIWKDLLEERLV